MTKEKEKQNAIARGKEKVWLPEKPVIRQPETELPDRVYEILGSTNLYFFGYTTLDFFTCWEKMYGDNPKYYKFVDGKLVECTRRQALATTDYRKHRILIFGQLVKEWNFLGEVTGEHYDFFLSLIKKQ